MTLIFIVNTPEFFLSHRLPLAIAARSAGFTVHVATGASLACQQIVDLGFEHHLLSMSRSGINPLSEIKTVFGLYQLMRHVSPDLVHLVTIKPVLYGGLMARMAGVPAMVAAVSGLGTVFVNRKRSRSWIRTGVEKFYKLALGHSNVKVIFQNSDDRSRLIGAGAVCEEKTVLIRGSGVSLDMYPVQPEPTGVPVITFAGRLLRDKGVEIIVMAASILQARGVESEFRLVGSTDPDNPTSVTEEKIKEWGRLENVKLLGFRSDIAQLFAESNIIVLPSFYGEGLPKVLIEAAACGRVVVTTNHPGCRDAIIPEVTGLLVPIRDPDALADAIQSLIEDPQRRRQMGAAGRSLAEREFTIEKVVDAHLAIYQELMTNGMTQ